MTKGEYCRLKGIHTCKPVFNPNDELDKKFKEDVDELVYALEQINLKEAADGGIQYQSGL